MRKVLFSLLVLSLSAQAQKFGFGIGVKGGFPFTDLVERAGTALPAVELDQTDNYLVGPAAELRIPFGFAVEVDGLYRGTQYHLTNAGTLPASLNSASWEIPYLGKFRFPIPLIRPFFSIGGAYRTFTDLPSEVNVSHNAFVAGGGIELQIKHLRLSGEARYLHWGEPARNVGVTLARSQGELLFGIMF